MFRKDRPDGAKVRRIGNPKKLAVLLTSLVLVILVAVGGTLAYLYTHTEPVTNTFTPGNVDIEIEEDFDTQFKKNVGVTNTGNVPVYVRAKLVINWVDANDNIVLSVPNDYSYTMTGLAADGSGWTLEDDGYYYYEDPVAAGSTTGNLLKECRAETPENPEYFLQVDVLSEVIQAEPTDAVEEVWGVTVAADGSISK